MTMLSHFGLLRFSGPDTQTFLQGQLSCDVAALQPMHATHGSYNTPKGRMLANFVLWRVGADFFMQLPRALCEPIHKRLSMYILRSKVQAADVSNEYALFGLVGENAVAGIGTPAAPMTLAEAWHSTQPFTVWPTAAILPSAPIFTSNDTRSIARTGPRAVT